MIEDEGDYQFFQASFIPSKVFLQITTIRTEKERNAHSHNNKAGDKSRSYYAVINSMAIMGKLKAEIAEDAN